MCSSHTSLMQKRIGHGKRNIMEHMFTVKMEVPMWSVYGSLWHEMATNSHPPTPMTQRCQMKMKCVSPIFPSTLIKRLKSICQTRFMLVCQCPRKYTLYTATQLHDSPRRVAARSALLTTPFLYRSMTFFIERSYPRIGSNDVMLHCSLFVASIPLVRSKIVSCYEIPCNLQ